ncbi:hypothetical protein MMC31_007472 [Peltigera leucophlebia]|nr:hypothetical protein [Peltigera leucophlebia]
MASSSPQVRVGVGAFVLKSAQESPENPYFLIGKRQNAHGAGTYALPGGHLEFGETPEQCAAREVIEETGLKVSNVRFLTATNDYMPAEGKHYISLYMVCTRDSNDVEPQVLEPDKCEGWEWASWEDLMTWVKRQSEAGEDTVLEKKLFPPFLNLVLQRPEVKIPTLEKVDVVSNLAGQTFDAPLNDPGVDCTNQYSSFEESSKTASVAVTAAVDNMDVLKCKPYHTSH